jgi:hypothetical protein
MHWHDRTATVGVLNNDVASALPDRLKAMSSQYSQELAR